MPACTLCLESAQVQCLDSKLRLFRCAACDHTFTVKPKEELEVYEEKYYLEKHANWFANPNFAYFERIRREAARRKPQARNLLDVGYGNGDFLKYLAEKNGNAVRLLGIDSLKIEHPAVEFIQGDFFVHPFRERFDMITSFMVIEHVEDPRAFAKKLHDCLEPGGFLFISTNNNGGLLYAIARFLKRVGIRVAYDRVYSDHHLNHFSNGSLRKVLENYGFETVNRRNHNYPMKAVDTPSANSFIKAAYLAAVWVIFRLSECFGNGFLQTFTCQKPIR